DPGRENESAVRLGRIGFDHVAGYLQDGLRSLNARSELTAVTDRVSPALAAELLAGESFVALDVRSPQERQSKAIAGSVHIPLNHLASRLDELPRQRSLIVYCAGGYRSSIAAS